MATRLKFFFFFILSIIQCSYCFVKPIKSATFKPVKLSSPLPSPTQGLLRLDLKRRLELGGKTVDESERNEAVDMEDVGFVLLAGGTGSRMKANMPKQFMILRGKAVLQHSLDLFLKTLPAYLENEGSRYVNFDFFYNEIIQIINLNIYFKFQVTKLCRPCDGSKISI